MWDEQRDCFCLGETCTESRFPKILLTNTHTHYSFHPNKGLQASVPACQPRLWNPPGVSPGAVPGPSRDYPPSSFLPVMVPWRFQGCGAGGSACPLTSGTWGWLSLHILGRGSTGLLPCPDPLQSSPGEPLLSLTSFSF